MVNKQLIKRRTLRSLYGKTFSLLDILLIIALTPLLAYSLWYSLLIVLIVMFSMYLQSFIKDKNHIFE